MPDDPTNNAPVPEMYADVHQNHDHYIIEAMVDADGNPNTADGDGKRTTPEEGYYRVIGAAQVHRPKSGKGVAYQFFWGQSYLAKQKLVPVPTEKFYITPPPGARLRRIDEKQFSLALHNIASDWDAISSGGFLDPSKEIDPGWINVNNSNGDLLGYIHSDTGWPTWNEDWYLPAVDNKILVEEKVTVQHLDDEPYHDGKTSRSHVVLALTGSYGYDSDHTNWYVMDIGGSYAAVIHRRILVVGGTNPYKYVDTWWLATNFVWWGSVAAAFDANLVSKPYDTAQKIRNGFSTSTRYQHQIKP